MLRDSMIENMRRPWIKIETATPDKPEICAIASRLRMDEDMVVGKLVRLWSWVALNRVNGSDLGVTLEFIDKLVSRKGFSAALCHAGWLVEKDGRLSLPNFDRHNSDLAKTRALTSQRVARHRVAKSLELADGNQNVTETPAVPKVEREASAEAESLLEDGIISDETPQRSDSGESEATKAIEITQLEDSEEDFENVLSINAIPTFKPLHTESALAEAMATEDPGLVTEDLPPAPAAMKEEEPQEPSPAKKSRRKTESENDGQPMLF